MAALVRAAGSLMAASRSDRIASCSSGDLPARSATVSPSSASDSCAVREPPAASAIVRCIRTSPDSSVPTSVPDSPAACPSSDTALVVMPVRSAIFWIWSP